MDLLPALTKTVREHSLFSPGEKILLSLSGGSDSLALFHLLFRLKDKWNLGLEVFHLDHALREESTEQAQKLCELMDNFGITCHCYRVDIKGIKKEKKGSLQEVARSERLKLLKETAEKIEASKIALGHQANDQAETLLFNLIRGGGTGGLGGIPYSGEDNIIHPLLDIWREDIDKYLKANELKPLEDPSNLKTVYARNKIRLEILPRLKRDFNPRVQEALWKTAKNLQEDDKYLKDLAREELNKAAEKKEVLELDLDRIRSLPSPVRKRVLLLACKQIAAEFSFYFKHLQLLEDLLEEKNAGKRLSLPGITVEKGYGKLFFWEKGKIEEKEDFCYSLDIPGEIKIPEAGIVLEAKLIPPGKEMFSEDKGALFNELKIGKRILVRNRRPGDRFFPQGAPGSKKIKDFFIDKKIDRCKRDLLPLVVTEKGEIAWVIGCRLSEKFVSQNLDEERVFLKFEKIKEENNGKRSERNSFH